MARSADKKKTPLKSPNRKKRLTAEQRRRVVIRLVAAVAALTLLVSLFLFALLDFMK